MNENNPPNRNCPKCGAALSANAVEGLCPACLLALNLAAQTELTGELPGTKGATTKTPTPEELAKFFPQLEIMECLGRGGMGVVYKARQPRLNRIVALKIIAPGREQDPAFAGRFVAEAQALARLSHPNIVTIHDFGETGGIYFLLMEYVDGVTLRQLLTTRRISPREALAIVPQICDALQFAHDQGIVHRDIKPENILLDRHGRVKVADFGLAKMIGGESEVTTEGVVTASSSFTEAGKVLGTPSYMAPEQVLHPAEVDHRADIYALGVVFYQMLTGELPDKKLQPPSNKVHIDVRLDEVVLRALEKEPSRRFQNVGDVKTQVETIAGTPPPHPDAAAAVENAVMTISKCAESDPRVQEALRSLRPRNAEQVTELLAPYLQSDKDAVRRAAIYILWKGAFAHISPAITPLQGVLRHPENYTRGMAALALGANHIVDSYAAVAAMARNDQDDYARRCARMALQSFGAAPPGQTPPAIPAQFSRTVIAGAICAFVAVVSTVLTLLIEVKAKKTAPEIMQILQTPEAGSSSVVQVWSFFRHVNRYFFLPLSIGGISVTTILGWVAVVQIRRSQGKLRGLGLALFDGLFFPCLFAGGIFTVISLGAAHSMTVSRRAPVLVLGVIGILFFYLLLLALLVRWIWQMARGPLDRAAASTSLGEAQLTGARGGPLAWAALLAACLAGVLGMLGSFLLPRPPQGLVWSILLAALLAVFLGLRKRKTFLGKTALVLGGGNVAVWLIIFTLFAFFARNRSRGFPPTGAVEDEPALPTSQSAGFGPVQERNITCGNASDSFYSFDTETFVAPPQDFDPASNSEADTQKLWRWLTEHHADIFAQRHDGQPILTMSDMVTAVIDENDFDRFTPGDLAENEVWRGALAAQFRPSVQSVLKGAGDGKITVAFQTRYHVIGMLQMMDINSDPPGVKIRYKLESK